MKKILVVGGAGYVGVVLCQELLARGYSVRVLDRLYFGSRPLDGIRSWIDLVVADMRKVPASVFKDVDAVINIGGLSNDPTAEYNPKANYEMNLTATKALAEACKEHNINRYIFGSSCAIYDQGIGFDAKDVVLDEDTEVNPRAAYSHSKYEAERVLLAMVDDDFCPVILRKGTIYGFSPRMRYDLVVNTFVKDVLSKGSITAFYGGEMWRPLIDVQDTARAYVSCLEADENKVRGEIFNLAYGNFRISELALRVREAMREIDIDMEVKVDYTYKGVRSYRVAATKIQRALGYKAEISIEDSVKAMVPLIREHGYTDFDNPIYYNIRWMKLLEEAKRVIDITGEVF